MHMNKKYKHTPWHVNYCYFLSYYCNEQKKSISIVIFHVLFCSTKDNYLVTCYEEKVVKEKTGPKIKMRLNMNWQKLFLDQHYYTSFIQLKDGKSFELALSSSALFLLYCKWKKNCHSFCLEFCHQHLNCLNTRKKIYTFFSV